MKIFEDERGRIIDVTDMRFEGLQIIESKKGSVRSNHYHKKGGHLLHVISGKMEYEESPIVNINGEGILLNQCRDIKTINAGESIFTGPMIAHKTTFLEDTIMVCCSTLKRTDGGYQDDLVRCEL